MCLILPLCAGSASVNWSARSLSGVCGYNISVHPLVRKFGYDTLDAVPSYAGNLDCRHVSLSLAALHTTTQRSQRYRGAPLGVEL